MNNTADISTESEDLKSAKLTGISNYYYYALHESRDLFCS